MLAADVSPDRRLESTIRTARPSINPDPGSDADDRIPLGVLRRLCLILDVDLTELVETRPSRPDDEVGDASGDEVRVEAALAEFDEGLSRDSLAEALGWPLERVVRALAAIEERLRPTGRRLRPIGWHRYAVAGVVSTDIFVSPYTPAATHLEQGRGYLT